LPGGIDKKLFIEKIKISNSKIIVILEKEDREFINFLRANNIYNVFLDSKVNLEEIINVIDKNDEEKYIRIPKELLEEIDYLKQAINNKNKVFDKVKILFNKFIEKIKKNNKVSKNSLMVLKKRKHSFIKCNKIISIFGTSGSREINICFNAFMYYRKRT